MHHLPILTGNTFTDINGLYTIVDDTATGINRVWTYTSPTTNKTYYIGWLEADWLKKWCITDYPALDADYISDICRTASQSSDEEAGWPWEYTTWYGTMSYTLESQPVLTAGQSAAGN